MDKAEEILKRLTIQYPVAKCALTHSSAWQLLVATILSAQCTDERVNKVTPKLFKRFPTAKDMNGANIEEVKLLIRSTGFYNNKAKNIKGAANVVMNKFDGKVPSNMKDIVTLPGVARKTGNVVLSVWFGKNEGVVVDTHVKRLAKRYGLTKETKPEKVEKDLMKLYKEKDWERISTLLIHHGRKIATARSPKNDEDVLKEFIEPTD